MKKQNKRFLTLALAGIAFWGIRGTARADDAGARMISSFETSSDISDARGRNVGLGVSNDGATDGRQALRAVFQPVAYPSVVWNASTPWDWRGMGMFALDVTNQNSDPIEVGVRVDDDARASGNSHNRTGRAVVAPGRTVTLMFNLGAAAPRSSSSSSAISLAHPMRGEPPLGSSGDSVSMSTSGTIDLSHIVSFQIFLKQPPSPRRFLIDNLRLLPPAAATGRYNDIVDPFGQYAKANWPGKITSGAQLTAQGASDANVTGPRASSSGLDSYGGWADGPKLTATGFFTTVKRGGKWWFVDPDGHLFLSFGPCEVNPTAPTYVDGRTAMFESLPGKGDQTAAFYRDGGKQYDFYAANLERKFGSDYIRNWRDETRARLKSWGLNTVGAFSGTIDSATEKFPSTVALSVTGSHAKLSAGLQRPIHDAFDPQFAADAANIFDKYAAPNKNSAYCVGYFVDNEMSWAGRGPEGGRYDLAYAALSAGADSPSKKAFVALLQAKYTTIGALNSAWGTSLSNWDALLPSFAPPRSAPAAEKADLLAFVSAFAHKYFSVVNAALKKADPNHLYLGCRFSWRTTEVIRACADVCDVVSFNIYEPRLSDDRWGYTKDLGKPCLVGEFHFGALDRGMFSAGLVTASSQKDRAQKYKNYIESVLDSPAFVGAHWFQYVDEPLTGRPNDGENYGIGLVSVTDTPYSELTDAMRDIHKTMYQRREKGKK